MNTSLAERSCLSESAVGLLTNKGNPFDLGGVSWAPGIDHGIFFEGIVDEATVVGVHRPELDRATCLPHFISVLLHALHQGVVLHGAVVLDVDAETLGLGVVLVNDPVDEILNVFEPFAVFSDEDFGLFGEDVKASAGVGVVFFDLDDKAEIT